MERSKGRRRVELKLNRETVRELSEEHLRAAAGGQEVAITQNFNAICMLTYQPRCF